MYDMYNDYYVYYICISYINNSSGKVRSARRASASAKGVPSTLRHGLDPASSHMLVSKMKPRMSQYKLLYLETANGSLSQL